MFPCVAGGKKTVIPKSEGGRGHLDATTEKSRITAWWNRYPHANIGSPVPEDEIVIDVDRDRYGFGSLEELEKRYGKLPETHTVGTGGGGLHLRFKLPAKLPLASPVRIKNRADAFGLMGVDVKACGGGYVVLPPSSTEGPYKVLDPRPPVGLPLAWVEALMEAQRPRSSGASSAPPRPRGYRTSESCTGESSAGEIPEGKRNETLASVAGRLHDGTRTPEALAGELQEINAARCSPPLPAGEVEKIARSVYRYRPCKQSRRAAPEAVEALDKIERELWGREWRGMGELSSRDVYVALIKKAREHGQLIPAGIRVSIGVRPLALAAGVGSVNTVRKAIDRLRLAGLVRRDDAGRRGNDAGALVLIAPRAKVTHSTHSSPLRTTELTCVSPLRAPRLRWSAPRFDRIGDEMVRTTIRRLGKSCGAVLDALDAGGGTMTVEALAGALHKARARDLRRRVIPRLEAAGVVRVFGDKVSLTPDWLDALNREREIAGEIAAHRRDVQRYNREREAYRNRHKIKPELVPEYISGTVVELEPAPDVDPELVEVLACYLELNPQDHPECHPPEDRRMQTSWLASTLWAEELLEHKPPVGAVELALLELEGVAA